MMTNHNNNTSKRKWLQNYNFIIVYEILMLCWKYLQLKVFKGHHSFGRKNMIFIISLITIILYFLFIIPIILENYSLV